MFITTRGVSRVLQDISIDRCVYMCLMYTDIHVCTHKRTHIYIYVRTEFSPSCPSSQGGSSVCSEVPLLLYRV